MGIALRVLIVEDSEDDARLMVRELSRGGYEPTWLRVETQEAMLAALDRQGWDVILADYTLPQFSAPAALRVVQRRGLDIPFIVVTGAVGEDVAVEMVKAGAHDYFLKDRLTRLPAAVSQELREAEERQARKRAEEAFAAQSKILDAFFTASVTPLVLLDKRYRFIRVNEAYAKACQREVSDFTGRNHFELYPSDARAIFDEVVRTGKPYKVDARPFVFPDHPEWGTTYWDWTLTPILDKAGETEFLVFSLKDVTEQKRAEEQIHLVTHALESAANGIVITDAEGTILWVNPAFTGMTGYGHDEAIGYNPRLLKSGRQDRSFYETLWHTIKTGNVWHGELINKRKDGTLYTEEMAIAPVRDGQGVISHFVAIKQDISDRRQMELQAQRLEQLATIGQLLAGIAHELKNPLFIVTGRLQLLREKLADREYDRLAQDIQKIEDAAQRMTGIAQRFLIVAKPWRPTLQSCSVPSLLKGAVDFMANELMKHRIKVVTDWPADLPPCTCDPAQLSQAFLNLILNAMQAMAQAHGQGTLTVSARLSTDSAQPPVPGEQQEEKWVEVRIQDDGPGIPPEHQAKLFEPFFTTKPLEEGTGLGLWTVRTIVMAMKGTVTVETEVGQGTTFIVRLPVLFVAPG